MHSRQWTKFRRAFGISLLAIVSFLIGRTAVLGAEQNQRPDYAKQSPAATTLPRVLNELMIGCNQEGSINYLLEKHLGRRLELVYGGLGNPEEAPAKEHDEAYVFRLGSRSPDTWSSDKIYLYFREGYLVYKCVVPDEKADPDEVFRREIKSGLQHPPNYPGLMDKVHWGEATEPQVSRFPMEDGEDTKDAASGGRIKRADLPKVRCGIALDGLPSSVAKQQGCNVLVLYQNVGPIALSDDLILTGFPIGPVILVSTDYRDSDKSTGVPGYFGFYGTKVYRIWFGEQVSAFRGAAFRLEPGESTYMWFYVPNLRSYAAVQAEVAGIWGADQQGESVNVRVWDAKSPKVAIPKADGK